MKKIVVSIIAIFVIISIVMIPVYATNVSQENSIESTSTTNLVELKDKALNTLKDYQVAYGNDTYGFVAYVLNIVRIYSIPLGFLGIVVAAIHRYVLGIRNTRKRIWRNDRNYYCHGYMPSVTINFCYRSKRLEGIN